MAETLGVVSAIVMPLFNIPLIVRIVRRKSSEDISLVWGIGVWVCVVGMLPSSIRSADAVLKFYGIINAVFFSLVTGVVLWYHPALRRK